MILECTHPFGNFTPGETVEVDDGAAYDTAYFKEHAEDKPPTDDDETVKAGEQ